MKLKEKMRIVNDMTKLLGIQLFEYQKLWLCLTTNRRTFESFNKVNKRLYRNKTDIL